MGLLSKIWNYLFDPNFGLGPDISEIPVKTNKCPNGQHSWRLEYRRKRNWEEINGIVSGTHYKIDDVIIFTRKCPNHTETSLQTLLDWKANGKSTVYISDNHWVCQYCEIGNKTEMYVAPLNEPPIKIPRIDTKKETVKLPYIPTPSSQTTTNYPHTVAVEPVKRYV